MAQGPQAGSGEGRERPQAVSPWQELDWSVTFAKSGVEGHLVLLGVCGLERTV